MRPDPTTAARLSVTNEGASVVVGVGGGWSLRRSIPSIGAAVAALDATPRPDSVRIQDEGLLAWDSSLLAAVSGVEAACAERGLPLDLTALPEEARSLLGVVREAPVPAGARKAGERELVDSLARLRKASPIADAVGIAVVEGLEFLGRTSLAVVRTLTGRTRHLGLGLTLAIQEAGVGTLPILAFIALLGGGVLSLLATQQMEKLGASLLAPNLVAIVIVRELGALATGFALAGRMGSANAADLANMVAGKEVEALRAMGVDAFDMLVAPRVLALVLMGPLLVLYAVTFGLLGSVLVSVGLMELPPADYLERTQTALGLTHAVAGIMKGAAFGFVVGMAGCYHGLRSGRGPAAVGRAVRAAVVTAILGVVIVDAASAAFFKWIRL